MNPHHDLLSAWSQLGGGPLKGKGKQFSGIAFWRAKADNETAVSIRFQGGKWKWHDFVAIEGGDVYDLVQKVLGCSLPEARKWLGETLQAPEKPAFTKDEAETAKFWAIGMAVAIERKLEQLAVVDPYSCKRRQWTQTLERVRTASTSERVELWKAYSSRHPRKAQRMVESPQRTWRLMEAALTDDAVKNMLGAVVDDEKRWHESRRSA